jgi:hypothetical protein
MLKTLDSFVVISDFSFSFVLLDPAAVLYKEGKIDDELAERNRFQ